MRSRSLALWVLLVLGGCQRDAPPTARKPRNPGVDGTPAGKGRQVTAGRIQDVRLSLDGRWAAYLQDVRKPPAEGLPPQVVVGDLYVASLAAGSPKKVGSA